MKGTLCCFFVLTLLMASWVSATTRTFAPNDALLPHFPGLVPETVNSQEGVGGGNGVREEKRGMRKIGSSPPSCDHKCYGCEPCEAIQVPTTATRRSHVSIQYTNYEPEGWKCKCGPSFYSP